MSLFSMDSPEHPVSLFEGLHSKVFQANFKLNYIEYIFDLRLMKITLGNLTFWLHPKTSFCRNEQHCYHFSHTWQVILSWNDDDDCVSPHLFMFYSSFFATFVCMWLLEKSVWKLKDRYPRGQDIWESSVPPCLIRYVNQVCAARSDLVNS